MTAKNETERDGGHSDRSEAGSGSNVFLWVGMSFTDTCPDSLLLLRLCLPSGTPQGTQPASRRSLRAPSFPLKHLPLVSTDSPVPAPAGGALLGPRRGQAPGLSDVWEGPTC